MTNRLIEYAIKSLKMKTGKVKIRFGHIYKIRDGLEVEI